MKILLLGNQGQLGRELKQKISKTGHLISSCSKKDFDFSDHKALETYASSFKPDIIINAAAYTHVDNAEHDKNISYEVNAKLPEFLAKYSLNTKSILIHFSSDYVFSGDSTCPYREDSEMKPINYYGYSKQQGDINIMKNCSKFFILRTSWVYSKYKGNFLTKVVQAAQNENDLKVVNDQIGVPTSSSFIANVVMDIINNNNASYGIYNVVPDGHASWYDFSTYIIDKLKNYKIKPIGIEKITSDQLNLIARRPSYSVLSNERLNNTVSFEIKDWRYYVDQLLQEVIDIT
tara:strand:+ start:540 stop:1409 length:870 start_codon:yes stop_codon:yes gene_type:complete